MPDIDRFKSVSVTHAAYTNIKEISDYLSKDLGIKMSLAKTIEYLSSNKAKELKLNGHSKS
ncbi:MAG TPA: hypothetical protein DEO86_13730 [Colwellia sp.]|jgi:hypothetical protein|nr:hypothetical protein [Colwellia sp.]